MINTTLCYIEKNGSYLMIHRVKKQNDMNKDKWIGIGGKFEYGETPFDCARREVFEETGLTPTKMIYKGIVTFQSNQFGTEYMHLFKITSTAGNVNEVCDEGVLEWIRKEDVFKLPQWEGDKYFLELLDKDVPFFSLKLTYEGDKLTSNVLEY